MVVAVVPAGIPAGNPARFSGSGGSHIAGDTGHNPPGPGTPAGEDTPPAVAVPLQTTAGDCNSSQLDHPCFLDPLSILFFSFPSDEKVMEKRRKEDRGKGEGEREKGKMPGGEFF